MGLSGPLTGAVFVYLYLHPYSISPQHSDQISESLYGSSVTVQTLDSRDADIVKMWRLYSIRSVKVISQGRF